MTLQDRNIIEYITLHNCCESGRLFLNSTDYYYLKQTYPNSPIVAWLRQNNENKNQTYCNISYGIWRPYQERFMAQIK
jgi:hypothetical protein